MTFPPTFLLSHLSTELCFRLPSVSLSGSVSGQFGGSVIRSVPGNLVFRCESRKGLSICVPSHILLSRRPLPGLQFQMASFLCLRRSKSRFVGNSFWVLSTDCHKVQSQERECWTGGCQRKPKDSPTDQGLNIYKRPKSVLTRSTFWCGGTSIVP